MTAALKQDVLAQDPMERLSVFLGVQGDAEISFLPKEDLPFPAPWQFKVQHAMTPAGPWTTLATLVANWDVVDVSRYRWDTLAESWYRIVLVDGNSAETPSRAVEAGNNWDRRDFIYARDACRRAYQMLRLGPAGTDGYLFKRRNWGEVCTACGNEITKQGTNSDCASCYGTGIVSGFYSAFPCRLAIDPPQFNRDIRQHVAQSDVIAHLAMGVNFPQITPGSDIWVDKNSGRRYHIKSLYRAVQSMRRIGLVGVWEIHQIETTDVLYQLETPDE